MPDASHPVIQNLSKRLRTAVTAGVVFGDVVYAPGGSCGPRVQSDFQLVVIVEGGAEVAVNGAPVRLAAGEVGLFLPGGHEWFRFATDRKTRHTWCSVRPGLVAPELAAACGRAARVQPVTHRFAQLMELGLTLPHAPGGAAAGLAEALGRALLHEFLHTDERRQGAGSREPDALRRAIEWIEEHAGEPLRLADLARASGVSPAQLVKLFRRHLGTTPLRHVWETRTRRGAQLLRETGLTVSEVAYRCGFQTPFHFSRWVRALHGVPPRELRARAWGATARRP